MTSGSAASTESRCAAAGDTVVHLALQQPNDPRRQIGQGSEAALSRQPSVVDEDHERRHQGDEHEREEACSDRRQNGREPIEDATRSAPDSTQPISVAEAHGGPSCARCP